MREHDKQMGQGTSHLMDQYRKVVPFVDLDRTYTPDINNGIKFLKSYSVAK